MDNIASPNVVDIVAMIIIVVGGIRGYFHGLSGEIGHLVGVVASFSAAIFSHGKVAGWIVEHTGQSERAAGALAFIVMFVTVLVIVFVVSKIVRHMIQSSLEEKKDKKWGAAIGMIKASIIVVVIFIAVNFWPQEYLNRVCGTESTIGSVVLKFMPGIRDQIEKKLEEKSRISDEQIVDGPGDRKETARHGKKR